MDEIYAKVVIAADGVNSVVARNSGLRPDFKDNAVAVGVKETLYLPKKRSSRDSTFKIKKAMPTSLLDTHPTV